MTTFVRVLGATAEEKPRALLEAVAEIHAPGERAAECMWSIFDRDPALFAAVPGSPFAYWVSETLRASFQRFCSFEGSDRTVKQGLVTADDFRFLRTWWEVSPDRLNQRWIGFSKGGAFSPFYADLPLRVGYSKADQVGLQAIGRYGRGATHYYRPGLTYPARPHGTGWFSLVPAGCIFSHNGPMAFTPEDHLLAYLALLNASVFHYLVQLQMARGHGGSGQTMTYEVGMIARTPVPELTDSDRDFLAGRGRRAWSLKRSLDTCNETSHAFLLPPGLNEAVLGLDSSAVERELDAIRTQINEAAFALYCIGPDDQAAVEAHSNHTSSSDTEQEPVDDDNEESGEEIAPVAASADALRSWIVGVAFGRFDPRLATGKRRVPPVPEPFDPLPSRSPGMYPEGDEPDERPDILVDDEGHVDDLTARALAVAARVRADVAENLRVWLAKEFFPLHVKMYSKSRRRAPIYWQLATPSAGYSVWLYIHAFGNDTLFRVQNDYVAPKLAYEERRLESLASELRDGATAAQRKEVAAQEAVVDDLRAFLDEAKRVAPLWKPNLDDSVIINFAPLWRLVPQNKSWQKELKSTWDALCEGKYDWAHLAMHLWPERVVPKCAKDRSLAVAHGLEDVFWVEGHDGKWTAHKTPTRSVDELVHERTSPAVKSALKSLLEAPAAAAKSGGRRSGGRRKTATAAEGGDA